MDRLFQAMAENPFLTVAVALVVGWFISMTGIVMKMIPLPKIRGEIRERVIFWRRMILLLHRLGGTVGLIGAMMLIVSLVLFAVLVFSPAT